MHGLTTATMLDLLKRYDRPGPRYTSYPTAVEFHEGIDEAIYRNRLARADRETEQPLSLYVHLPFCEARCTFCACNVVVTKDPQVARRYLDFLDVEIDLLADHLPHRRRVSQLHWGGGTPTYFGQDDLTRLFARLGRHFTFTPDAEIGVEVDPRVTSAEQLSGLRDLGFNRLSLGVQDFDPAVQETVGRVQSFEVTRASVDAGRVLGYGSINLDLIYGLPYQTVDGFRRTLDLVLALRPDRVAVYSFAFVPWIRAEMKHWPADALPDPCVKIELLARAVDAFTGAGYRQIGMDHFALPNDELTRAADARSLHRNFMGYTVQSARDMVAVGVSGIGDLQETYVQNARKLSDYYAALDRGHFPIERGYVLNQDDVIRRHVITELMCTGHLDMERVERQFAISFRQYFAAELAALTREGSPSTDGLVDVRDHAIALTARGRLFLRTVCTVFDRYLRARLAGPRPVFSRTV
jgi:oxygen-independent coproporphyrinogen-3 oxidase